MPQIFQVLRCYKCFVFQVHQAKKSNKFECKMCGEKQSIKRHYGIGTAKDCRLHVQKLNGIRCEKDEIKNHNIDNDYDEPDEPICEKPEHIETKNSKWVAYVDKEEIDKSESHESMYLEDTEVVLEVPVKRPRHNRKPAKFSIPYSKTINNICKQNAQIVDDTMKDQNNSDNESSLTIEDSIHIHSKMDENNSQMESVEIIKKENVNVSNKFIPPNVHKNSKWAQYIDSSNETHEEETQEDTHLTHIEKTEGNACDLFSLCNDAELDNVLDL